MVDATEKEAPKSARQLHVEALQVERENLTRRPKSETQARRLGEVDEQLDQFADEPVKRTRETRKA